MPYCPVCRFEYDSSVKRCPDCGGELLPTPPPDAAAHEGSPLVPLRTVGDPSEADVIRATLAEAGIPAVVRRHGPITGHLGLVTDGLTEDYAIVSVPADRLAEAEELLETAESGAAEWLEGMGDEEEDDTR